MKPVFKIDSFFVKFWPFKIRENFIYLNNFVYPLYKSGYFFGATISLIWIFSGTKNCLLGNRYFKLKQFQVKLNNYQRITNRLPHAKSLDIFLKFSSTELSNSSVHRKLKTLNTFLVTIISQKLSDIRGEPLHHPQQC